MTLPPCADKRSGCPISFALDLFGDRWTLLILRDLILQGKRRYREFLKADEGIASNILSERLKRLEAADIVTRRTDPEDRRQLIYEPTSKGEKTAARAARDRRMGCESRREYGGADQVCREFLCGPRVVLSQPPRANWRFVRGRRQTRWLIH